MFGIGLQELVIILVIALVIFGPTKLPKSAAGWPKPSETSERASVAMIQRTPPRKPRKKLLKKLLRTRHNSDLAMKNWE
jgi:sec-independent protein translocase protein TatA